RDTLRPPVIATWCWNLLEPYLRRNLTNRGVERPTRKQVLEEFARVWPEVTATLGVQEPYAGTIRFKWLVRLPSADAGLFLDDAIDRRLPMPEIMKWDAELADRTREVLDLVEHLRSRRIG